MNYGHQLQTGLLLTTPTDDSNAACTLAGQADELGYDHLLVQDVPGDDESFDPWTLLTWIAAETERVQIAAHITDVPTRLPSVLARSALSLDLLSDGRLTLWLGHQGESADELDAALDVIQGIMDLGEKRRLRIRGGYYPLEGAQRGPMPAHEIPIWLSAAGPETLRLVGEKSDGWLAPFENMRPVDLDVANEYIDNAARDAGRDPREIRRMIIISGDTAESPVEDLLPLIVEHGVGTILLKSEDPAIIERFASETVPALRAAAERALPDGLSSTPVRRASARAKRMPGIDYEGVPESLNDSVIEPGDFNYPSVRSTYLRGGSPGIVLQPRSASEVVDALAYARCHPDLPLSIRSAGHGISGRSTNKGGIVIDLSKMNSIEVLDSETGRVRLEPGARWMDVAAELAPYGLGLSSGDYGGVGVGGLATAGGIGWLSRKHGLTIDHLKSVEMVLADGSIVRASEDENSDLFWAVRGAGANFGIVTSFEFEAYQVGNVGFGMFVLDAADTAGFLERWGQIVEASPRDLTSFLIMGPPRSGQPMAAQVMTVVDSEEPERIVELLQPVANISPLYNQQVVITPYAALMANAQGSYYDAVGEPAARSGLVDHLTPEFAAAAEKLIRSGAVYFFQIRSVGGAVSDVPADATAYANRSANFSVTAFGPHRDRVNAEWDEMAKHFNGLYISFETDQRPERLDDAFPGQALQRLRELKTKYDPENVFRDNFSVAVQG
jgi:FAD/FMN-containing dehydrogenase/alkanesulfonate monooxygenase SsuD/methylene tetrahydromethanopterin reductase-like flavin-dependent oxidoreductase (luciferase family)